MGDPSSKPEGTLTTPQLVARIEAEFGLRLSSQSIRNYMARPNDPLPCAYKGKNGQAHLFAWEDFLTWFDAETDRAGTLPEPTSPEDPAAAPHHIDSLDWHSARTVSAREQAKRDVLVTGKMEGKLGDIETMTRTAEDRARLAVQQLLAIPSRISPRLVNLADELAIDRIIDAEIRLVCQQIEADTRAALLGADDLDPKPDQEQAA
jgi:hypothetical protein